MSRSRKKHPSCSIVCYFSNKKCRTIANKKMRRYNKTIINSLLGRGIESILSIDNGECFKILREVSNTYDFDSDGLPGVYDPHQLLTDWTKSDSWKNYSTGEKTTLAREVRNRNYKFIKNYYYK